MAYYIKIVIFEIYAKLPSVILVISGCSETAIIHDLGSCVPSSNLGTPTKSMRKIEKKCWPEYFEKILEGKKTFDLRLNDFVIGALDKTNFYDKKVGVWREGSSDLSDCRIMNYMGMDLPFVNEMKLLIYKDELGRGVDKKDVRAMEDQLKTEWK